MNEKNITRVTAETLLKSEDLTDWERVRAMSDAEIEQNAQSDPDNPLLDEDEEMGRVVYFDADGNRHILSDAVVRCDRKSE
ncbi:MAG: hypothetical protein HC890_04540 [Chloroflexaceae bacterium]|nr:hypothetical protein [Chloroflexaceae bacterium]